MSRKSRTQDFSLNHDRTEDVLTMANANDKSAAPLVASKGRALLTGAVAALFAGAVAPAHASGPDKELIELCAAWRQTADRLANIFDADWSEEDRVLDRELNNAVYGLERRIFDIKAATMAGLKAKVGVLDYMDTGMGISPTPEYAASLVTDFVALGSAW